MSCKIGSMVLKRLKSIKTKIKLQRLSTGTSSKLVVDDYK